MSKDHLLLKYKMGRNDQLYHCHVQIQDNVHLVDASRKDIAVNCEKYA
jgi:hypothetical protein